MNIATLDYNLTSTGSSSSSSSSSSSGGSGGGIVSGATYKILARHSGKSLDIYTANNNLLQYDYWGGSNQKFIVTSVGSGYYRISPTHNSSHGLDVAQQSTANGANVGTYSYWGGYNQQWQINDLGNGYYSIINRNSGKSLDVDGVSTANGANIVQWTYWGGENQQFSFTQL